MSLLSAALLGLALAGYALAAVAYGVSLGVRSRAVAWWGRAVLVGAAAVHGVGLLARGLALGYPPLATSVEGLTSYGWIVVVAYLLFEARSQTVAPGAFIAPLALIAVAALLVRQPGALDPGADPVIPILRSIWLPLHVGSILLGYALFTLGFVAAVLYLVQDRHLQRKRPPSAGHRLLPLATAEVMECRFIAVGFSLMTIAMVTGAIWSWQVWGTPWVWEPKQTLALVTWSLFGVSGVRPLRRALRGRRAAWLVVAGFASVLVTYLGAGLLATEGLHRF
ncbi:MAG: cytochrome c biogenesis protein CcsA [Chloroflexi bacterium]|nr:cytochrome c biogenesis protein CcsA [Chloroflexota bacterium]